MNRRDLGLGLPRMFSVFCVGTILAWPHADFVFLLCFFGGGILRIIVLIWGVPMIFRAVSIIATLVEGHYTQICASGRPLASHAPLGSADPGGSRSSSAPFTASFLVGRVPLLKNRLQKK